MMTESPDPNETSADAPQASPSADRFPVAEVHESSPTWSRQPSKFWWLTGLCVIVAVGLAWWSQDPPGTAVLIRFDQGHGIKVGDSVRHRGIDVGHVVRVNLRPDMNGVDVNVSLDAHADAVARSGSRFWIVRPRVDLSGVTGLETTLGGKYIEVALGTLSQRESAQPQYAFDGLSQPPPDAADLGGIELVLRGKERFGVGVGSPVTYRGIEIGRVLDSHLSPDSLAVDTRVHIHEAHRWLLSSESKFWKKSGISVDLGVTGVRVDADTLSNIVRGGIGVITPGNSGDEVLPGTRFTLHEKAEEDWFDAATSMTRLKQPRPESLAVQTRQTRSFLGFDRVKEDFGLAMVRSGQLFIPADLVENQDQLEFSILTSPTQTIAPETFIKGDANGLASSPLSATIPDSAASNRFRVADVPEDVFVLASQASGESMLQMLPADGLVARGRTWEVRDSRFGRRVWHGAPVIAVQDEKILGLLLVGSDGIRIGLWDPPSDNQVVDSEPDL